MDEISAIEDIARGAALKGSQIIMDRFCQRQQIWAKSPFEVVTETDLASEKAIISVIRRFYPEHTILTEEQGELPGSIEHVWIIDPLDGTLKYVLGEPYFSISIAYEFQGNIKLALVYNPYTKDIYIACPDRGAFKNEVALHVSSTNGLADKFVCCDWGGSKALQRQGLDYLSKLLPPATRGVGVNFSPALDLCNLAEGNISVMISNGTTTMDHAAGALIVKEAGGNVRSFGQRIWSHRFQGIIATNSPDLDEKIEGLLSTYLDYGQQA